VDHYLTGAPDTHPPCRPASGTGGIILGSICPGTRHCVNDLQRLFSRERNLLQLVLNFERLSDDQRLHPSLMFIFSTSFVVEKMNMVNSYFVPTA
jgi:hypothetical protein